MLTSAMNKTLCTLRGLYKCVICGGKQSAAYESCQLIEKREVISMVVNKHISHVDARQIIVQKRLFANLLSSAPILPSVVNLPSKHSCVSQPLFDKQAMVYTKKYSQPAPYMLTSVCTQTNVTIE